MRGLLLTWMCVLLVQSVALAIAPPASVTASRGTLTNHVYVQWAAVSGATDYQVRLGTTLSGSSVVPEWTSEWQTSLDLIHSNAVVGRTYYYQVRSTTNPANTSSYSSWNSVAAWGYRPLPLAEVMTNSSLQFATGGDASWVGQYPPSGSTPAFVNQPIQANQLTWLSVTVTGAGTLSFKWCTDCDGWDGLMCEVNGLDTGLYKYGEHTDWSAETLELKGETNTVTWSYYNQPYGEAGWGCGWIKDVVWTPSSTALLNAPRNVSATDGNLFERTRVTWDAVEGASHYRVWRTDSTNFLPDVVSPWTTDLSFDDATGFPVGKTYYYYVTAASNASGAAESPLSDPDSGFSASGPVNDDLANALELSGSYGDCVSGTCLWATTESVNEPIHAGETSATNSVWWKWASLINGFERFSVQGSGTNLPLVIAVYTNVGSMLGFSTFVGCGSGRMETNGWAIAQFSVCTGQVYYFAVAGVNGEGGPVRLQWEPVWSKAVPANVRATQGTLFEKVRITWDAVPDATNYEVWRQTSLQRPDAKRISAWQGACDFEDLTARVGVTYYYSVRATVDGAEQAAGALSAPVAGYSGSYPLNDNRASALAIAGCYGEMPGTNSWATGETAEPLHGGLPDATNSVWWTWMAPTNASFTFTVTPSANALWSPVLAVYTNAAIGGTLLPVTAGFSITNGGKAQVAFDAVAGQAYALAVAGADGSGGSFALDWALSLLPPSGVMASDGTEFWVTLVAWEPVEGATCYEVSRALAPDGEREILSGWITELEFEDWTGRLNEPYYYFVRARTEAWGGLLSGYSQPMVGRAGDFPANDDCADAALLGGVSGSVSGDSLWATREAGEPQHGGFSDAGASIWWLWTAPVSAPVTFATQEGIAFDAVVAVYTNGVGGALVPVASAERGAGVRAQVSFCASAGTTYLIAVAGRPNVGGFVTLNWSYGTWRFAAPSGIAATQAAFNDRIEVTWGSVPEATVYELSRATTSGGVSTVVMGWTNAVAFVDTNVVAGQTYYYLVRAALDDSGALAGAYSVPAAGWARNAEPPAAPAISEMAFVSFGGVPVLRVTFAAQAGVVYEVVTSTALGAGAAWRSLTPRVSVTASSNGVCTLEAPVEPGVASAFFRIEASRP